MNNRLGIATRFYGYSVADRKRLETWLRAALEVVSPEHVLIAVHTVADKSGSLAFLQKKYPRVTAFSVQPWGRVVQAPNALLLKGAEMRLNRMLFVSTEYPVSKQLINSLGQHLDKESLVVGARLATHSFGAGSGEIVVIEHADGLQIPWNTCALWSVPHLVHTGFVLTADSAHDPDNAGMEEMGTIAAQQILWPNKAKAKLVALPEQLLVPNTYGWNIQRQERYARNLHSKRSRSAAQLKRLSLKRPEVVHVAARGQKL